MRVIQMGNNPKEAENIVQCHKCNTTFAYKNEDIKPDFRDGAYVICPNDSCKAFIAASTPILNNPFKD